MVQQKQTDNAKRKTASSTKKDAREAAHVVVSGKRSGRFSNSDKIYSEFKAVDSIKPAHSSDRVVRRRGKVFVVRKSEIERDAAWNDKINDILDGADNALKLSAPALKEAKKQLAAMKKIATRLA